MGRVADMEFVRLEHFAGWDSHPLESTAFPRRTPKAAGGDRQQRSREQTVAGKSALLAVEQGAHEAPIISEDAPALVSNAISIDELFVDTEAASISLVFRQVREAEERQCAVARPF